MRTRNLLAAFAVAAAVTTSAYAGVINVAMDQQINVGKPGTAQSPTGNAIYPLAGTGSSLSFGTDGTDGWSRCTTTGGGWYYHYLDLNLAGIGAVDLSQAGSTVSFDARYFQDPQTNAGAYADAPIFARVYTYAADGNTALGYRDFGIVYATQPTWNNPRFPDWTRVTIDVNSAGTVTNVGTGLYDPSKISRIRWYGTDWQGHGQDFVDVKDVSLSGTGIVPEPGTISLLLTGLLPFAARLRKRKA